MKKTTYVLKRKRDGWYQAIGNSHTSDPASAMMLEDIDIEEWQKVYGDEYGIIPLIEAKEIE